MTTTATTSVAMSERRAETSSRAVGTRGPNARGILRSEWVKLRSLRSNLWIVLGATAVLVATGVIFSGFVGDVFHNPDEAAQFANDPAGATLQGTLLTPLVIGALGILAMTGEYATGTIRTSLTMVPTRLPVLWAKVAVVAVVSFMTMLAATVLVFFVGQALISQGSVATASLTDPGVARALLGTAGYLTGVALLGLGLGATLRSSVGAIATLVTIVLLLPSIGSILLPASWRVDVLKFLPSNAGDAMTRVHATPDLLSPAAGGAVLLAWVVLALVAGAAALRTRSA